MSKDKNQDDWIAPLHYEPKVEGSKGLFCHGTIDYWHKHLEQTFRDTGFTVKLAFANPDFIIFEITS